MLRALKYFRLMMCADVKQVKACLLVKSPCLALPMKLVLKHVLKPCNIAKSILLKLFDKSS